MKTRRTLLNASGTWRMDKDSAAAVTVARTLRQLLDDPRPFHLINTLVAERGEVDHLVVGLTGIFAIETCSEEGNVAVDRDGEGLAQVDCQESLLRARRGATAVRDRLRRRGFDVRVQGVLCLPFANLSRPQYVDGMIVARPEHLEYLLRHWPGQNLSAAEAARVFAALQTRAHRVAA